MAISTTIVTPVSTGWTSLGTVGIIAVSTGSATANTFAFADSDPGAGLAAGFHLNTNEPFIPTAGLTGWSATKLWVRGTVQVVVAS